MRSVSIAEFKKNPSGTLRKARKTPIVLTIDDQPEAVIFHLEGEGIPSQSKVRLAVVTALFADGAISLSEAARVAKMPIAEFIKHLGQLGIPAITGSAEDAAHDLEVLRKWTASS
jgi:predicted HTH domain antitoxin